MQNRIGRMLEMLLRVRSMLGRPEFAPLASSPAIATLGRTIGDLQGYEGQQDLGSRSSRGETAKQRKLREALLVQMRTVSAAARLEIPKEAELVKFDTPRGGVAARRLLAAASGMSEAAIQHQDVLLAGGLEPGFIDRLNAAATAYQESLTGRKNHRGARRQATVAINVIATRTRQLVLVLDGRVKQLLGDEPSIIAEWKQAIRIGKKLGGSHAVTDAAAPAVPATSEALAPAT